MEIAYTLGPEDVTAYQKHSFNINPDLKRGYYMGYAWGILAAGVFLLLLGPINIWSILPVILFLIIYFILYPVSIRHQLSASGRYLAKHGRNRGLLGPHKMTISEQGLEDSHTFGDSRLRWQGVEDILESSTHIFIRTSLSSSYVIPKAAFSDPALAQEFLQTAKRFYKTTNHT